MYKEACRHFATEVLCAEPEPDAVEYLDMAFRLNVLTAAAGKESPNVATRRRPPDETVGRWHLIISYESCAAQKTYSQAYPRILRNLNCEGNHNGNLHHSTRCDR